MNRPILAVMILALFGASLASRADALEQATDACVQAFVAAHLPKEQPVVVDKENFWTGPLDARSRTYRIELTATGKISGRQFAKGVCIASHSGEVIALNGRRPPRVARATVATTGPVPR
jgi:hypothetical protein